jgi:hypothetical protein
VGEGFWRRGGEIPTAVKWEDRIIEIREGSWSYVAGPIGRAPGALYIIFHSTNFGKRCITSLAEIQMQNLTLEVEEGSPRIMKSCLNLVEWFSEVVCLMLKIRCKALNYFLALSFSTPNWTKFLSATNENSHYVYHLCKDSIRIYTFSYKVKYMRNHIC